MSVDCDCCAVAEDPCIADIGILISDDPVAVDQACIDLVYACSDPGKPHLIERIESRNGTYTIDCAEALGCGSKEYELIEIAETKRSERRGVRFFLSSFLALTHLDFAVSCLILLDAVANEDQNLAVGTAAFVVGHHVQLVKHLFVNADG